MTREDVAHGSELPASAVSGAGMRRLVEKIVADRVLMSLLRIKSVPVSVLLQKCGQSVNKDNCLKLIKALDELSASQIGSDLLLDFNVRYLLQKRTLLVTTGELGPSARRSMDGQTAILKLIDDRVDLEKSAVVLGDEFMRTSYKKLSEDLDRYDQVLRACDVSLDLESALQSCQIDKDAWKRLKLSIARHGLKTHDVRLAQEVEVHGALMRRVMLTVSRSNPMRKAIGNLIGQAMTYAAGTEVPAPSNEARLDDEPVIEDRELRSAYGRYKGVLRDCERSMSLPEGLTRSAMPLSEWRELVRRMQANELSQSVEFTQMVVINGAQVEAIMRRYIGRSLKEAVSELIEIGLSLKTVA